MHDELIVINGYIIYVGKNHPRYTEITDALHNKPIAESGYDYRLREDLTWEKYELPTIEEEQTAYTAEQLEAMTSTELREICAELGISGTMTKANMISLILGKQSNSL
ncbi:MAG: Rho termination factor N-terminal domain-containing protein [Treponema sp.]|nr:Rho termination factor N-terminal domain-containing protein [Candidatus Treponema caballi]